MIYMPMNELELTVDVLAPQERGLALKCLADYCAGHGGRFLPDYWKRDEYKDWLRLYGRVILRRHYADDEDKRFTLVVPNDEETMTVWDYFHQPIKGSPAAPWFTVHRAFNMNHRGLLLRRNWNAYHSVFRDIQVPPVDAPSLIPGIKPNTWIVDGVATEVYPAKSQPLPWKAPKI